MKKRILVLSVTCSALLAAPSATAANHGLTEASACGAYHGMFGAPAHGTLTPIVPDFASSGVFKGGFVGANARDPLCRS